MIHDVNDQMEKDSIKISILLEDTGSSPLITALRNSSLYKPPCVQGV